MTFWDAEMQASLAADRADAESLMTLTLAVYSPDGWDVVDNRRVPKFVSEVGTVGKVQAASGDDTSTRTVDVGGVDVPVLVGGLHIPVGAAVPVAGERGVGWEYVVTAVSGGADPALVGRRYLVVGAPVKSFATARRLDVIEL